MPKPADKKSEAERRARILYRQLMRVKPANLTERQWTIKAGVSSSFFSNLQGGGSKPPSEPSIGNLRAIVEAVGLSLHDFFALEASSRLLPTRQDVANVLEDAWRDLPTHENEQVAYLATAVSSALALPEGRSSTAANEDDRGLASPEEASPRRRATRKP